MQTRVRPKRNSRWAIEVYDKYHNGWVECLYRGSFDRANKTSQKLAADTYDVEQHEGCMSVRIRPCKSEGWMVEVEDPYEKDWISVREVSSLKSAKKYASKLSKQKLTVQIGAGEEKDVFMINLKHEAGMNPVQVSKNAVTPEAPDNEKGDW